MSEMSRLKIIIWNSFLTSTLLFFTSPLDLPVPGLGLCCPVEEFHLRSCKFPAIDCCDDGPVLSQRKLSHGTIALKPARSENIDQTSIGPVRTCSFAGEVLMRAAKS